MSEQRQGDHDPVPTNLAAQAAQGAIAAVGTALAVTTLSALVVTATGARLGLDLARAAMPKKGRAGLLKGGRGRPL